MSSSNEDDNLSVGRQWLLVKILIGLVALLGVAVIVTVIAVIVVSDNANKTSGPKVPIVGGNNASTSTQKPKIPTTHEVCETDFCRKTAKELQMFMNPSVDPCKDFYEFVCGGWLKRTPIPADKNSISGFASISDLINNRTRDLIETKNGNDIEAIKKRKILYQSCFDTDTIERRGVKPLMDFFSTNSLSFPIVNSGWNEAHYDIENEIVKYKQLGLASLFTLKPEYSANKKPNANGKILSLDVVAQKMMASKSDYTNKAKVEMYRSYLRNLTSILAPGRDHSSDIEDIINYEIGASKFMYEPGTKPTLQDTYMEFKLSELRTFIPQWFNLKKYTKEVMMSKGIDIDMTDDENVRFDNWNKTREYAEYTVKVKNRTLANVLALSAVASLMKHLPENIRNVSYEFERQRSGSEPSPRWKQCIAAMDLATTRMYADTYFPREDQSKIDEMLLLIKAQVQVMIARCDWMDKKTKQEAMNKAANMKDDAGYPVWILNDTKLNEYYKQFAFNKKKSFENTASLLKEKLFNSLRQMRDMEDYKEWILYPLNINAYYRRFYNGMVFLAGILHQPFFDGRYLRAVNYGGIGMIIGHEITHGFDAEGRGFDSRGNLRDWWTEDSSKKYNKRARCIVEQYDKYRVEAISRTVNGNLTKSENIADIGGIKAAFKAYRSWADYQGKEEPRLPGLNFTPNQLFFISFARVFCSKLRPQKAKYNIDNDTHSPNNLRVFGSLVGYKAFTDAFNCPVGSAMNPGKSCLLW